MSEIIYLYISRAKDDTVAENLLIYVYPPYTFRITEIKYIYLTPILHTYTSHSIRRHTLYTSSTQPIRVHAYCVGTHWHAAHYSLQPSIALDRNEANRAKPVKGEEVVGKKNLQLSHSVFKQTIYRSPPVYIQDDHRTQVLDHRMDLTNRPLMCCDEY